MKEDLRSVGRYSGEDDPAGRLGVKVRIGRENVFGGPCPSTWSGMTGDFRVPGIPRFVTVKAGEHRETRGYDGDGRLDRWRSGMGWY